MKDFLNNLSYSLFFILLIITVVFFMIQYDKNYYKKFEDPFDGKIY